MARINGLLVVRSGSLFRADDEVESESDSLGRMVVRFSPFDTWYEINSYWEGRFLERTVPGAFKKTAKEAKRSDGLYSTKVLYNHGSDLHIGDKMLMVPDRFEEANEDGYYGPVIEGDLLDTSYNRDLLPGLKRDAYGSSFMFNVIREEWNAEPDPSDYNPDGIPERTVREVRTFEAGPVTWPASPTATAGMRGLSGTDAFMERIAARSAQRHQTLVDCYTAFRAMNKTPDMKASIPAPGSEPSRQIDEAATERARLLRSRRLELMKMGY